MVNAADVLGYGFEGALYCPDCASKGDAAPSDEGWPVFACEVQTGDSCDDCGELLLD